MAQTRVGIRNGSLFNNNSTLWNGLLAYYTGDGTANDALGNYNGTLVNGATYGTGKIGQGFSFDGVNDYINMGDVLDIGLDSWTYNTWIKRSDFSLAHKQILSKAILGPGIGRYAFAVSYNKLFAFIDYGPTVSTQSAQILLYGDTLINQNEWYMVTFVIDRNFGLNLYINGLQETFTVKDGFGNQKNNNFNDLTPYSEVTYNNTFPFRIGSYTSLSYGAANLFGGTIDEVGVWNRVLNPTELTELYNAGAGKQYPN